MQMDIITIIRGFGTTVVEGWKRTNVDGAHNPLEEPLLTCVKIRTTDWTPREELQRLTLARAYDGWYVYTGSGWGPDSDYALLRQRCYAVYLIGTWYILGAIREGKLPNDEPF